MKIEISPDNMIKPYFMDIKINYLPSDFNQTPEEFVKVQKELI